MHLNVQSWHGEGSCVGGGKAGECDSSLLKRATFTYQWGGAAEFDPSFLNLIIAHNKTPSLNLTI